MHRKYRKTPQTDHKQIHTVSEAENKNTKRLNEWLTEKQKRLNKRKKGSQRQEEGQTHTQKK